MQQLLTCLRNQQLFHPLQPVVVSITSTKESGSTTNDNTYHLKNAIIHPSLAIRYEFLFVRCFIQYFKTYIQNLENVGGFLAWLL
jgi:hypothetical protein